MAGGASAEQSFRVSTEDDRKRLSWILSNSPRAAHEASFGMTNGSHPQPSAPQETPAASSQDTPGTSSSSSAAAGTASSSSTAPTADTPSTSKASKTSGYELHTAPATRVAEATEITNNS